MQLGGTLVRKVPAAVYKMWEGNFRLKNCKSYLLLNRLIMVVIKMTKFGAEMMDLSILEILEIFLAGE